VSKAQFNDEIFLLIWDDIIGESHGDGAAEAQLRPLEGMHGNPLARRRNCTSEVAKKLYIKDSLILAGLASR